MSVPRLSIATASGISRSRDDSDRLLRYVIVRAFAAGATCIHIRREEDETELSFCREGRSCLLPDPPSHVVDGIAVALLRYRPLKSRLVDWWKSGKSPHVTTIESGEIELRIGGAKGLVQFEIFPTAIGLLVGLALPNDRQMSDAALPLLCAYERERLDRLSHGDGLLTA